MFSIFSINLSRNSQNAAILTIIKKSGNCQRRFTANCSKFLASHSIYREMRYNFTPTFSKIRKIWALCLSWPDLCYRGRPKARSIRNFLYQLSTANFQRCQSLQLLKVPWSENFYLQKWSALSNVKDSFLNLFDISFHLNNASINFKYHLIFLCKLQG